MSAVLGRTLPYDDLQALRGRLVKANPSFMKLDEAPSAKWGMFGKAGPIAAEPFRPTIDNFYMTDPISRASVTMAQCTEQMRGNGKGKTGTDG